MNALIDAITDMREEDALKITQQEIDAGTGPHIQLTLTNFAIKYSKNKAIIMALKLVSGNHLSAEEKI